MDRTALRDDDVSLTELERAFRESGGVSKPAAKAVRIVPKCAPVQASCASSLAYPGQIIYKVAFLACSTMSTSHMMSMQQVQAK
jgi:hypothetical protein